MDYINLISHCADKAKSADNPAQEFLEEATRQVRQLGANPELLCLLDDLIEAHWHT